MGIIDQIKQSTQDRINERKAAQNGQPIPSNEEQVKQNPFAPPQTFKPDYSLTGNNPNKVSTAGIGMVNDPAMQQHVTEENAMRAGVGDTFFDVKRDRFISEDDLNPMAYTEQLSSQFAKSVGYGLGQMIGQYGDITQFLGDKFTFGLLDMEEGSVLSRFLQEQGQSIMDANQMDVPENVENPEFSFSSFLNPQFWAIQGGRFAPQLVEILATAGVAGLAKKTVQKGMQGVMKRELRDILASKTEQEMLEASSKLAGKGYKATTGAKYGGAKGIQEVSGTGRGIRGFMMTDRGELTNNFGNIIQGLTGGVLMNQRVSLANAGEVYNTYNDLNNSFKLENNGQELFTQEELGEMAAQTYWNNTSYVGMDILSWAMTFGNGLGKLKERGLNNFRKVLSPEMQLKVSRGLFSKTVMPMTRASYRLAKKAVPEALEEMVQESWEEWSKLKAYQDVHGSTAGYQGPVSKEYAGALDSFWDYFTSKDTEAIRTIAGAMGMVAGGAFNAKVLFNNSANDAYKIYNRSENLKTLFKNGTKGKSMHQYNIRAIMAELLFEGKGARFAEFLDHHYKNDIVNEDEVSHYTNLYNDAARVFDNIKDLNLEIPAKKALMNNVFLGNYYDEKIAEEEQSMHDRINLLVGTIENEDERNKAVERERKIFEAKTKGLAEMMITSEQNIQDIIQGKPAKRSIFDVTIDEYGNERIVPGDINEGTTDEVPMDDTEMRTEIDNNEDVEVTPESEKKSWVPRNIRNRAKAFIDNLLGRNEPGSETNAEPTIEERVDGAIDALTNPESATEIELSPQERADEEISTLEFDPELKSWKTNKRILPASEGTKGRAKKFIENNPDLAENQFIDEDGNVISATDTDDNLDNADGSKTMPETITYTDDAGKEIQLKRNRQFVGNNNNEAVYGYGKKIKKVRRVSKEDLSKKTPVKKEKPKSETNTETATEKKTETSSESQINKNISDQEQALIEKWASEEDTQAQPESEEDIMEKLRQRKMKGEVTETDDSDLFGVSKREGAQDLPTYKSGHERIKSKKRTYNVFNRKQRISNLRTYNDESQNFFDSDLMKISEMISINQNLAERFPAEHRPSVYIIDSVAQKYGTPAVGYTIAGAVYIDGNSWQQDNVYMHEMSHIYFQLTRNTPETKAFLREALKNKSLVDYVKDLYWDQEVIGIKMPDGSVEKVTLENVQISKEEKDLIYNDPYVVKLSEEERNSIWNEEVFTHTLEGPLSKAYDKFFTPQYDAKRQLQSKRWWRSVKDRFTNPDPDKQAFNERDLLNILTESELESYNDSKEFILRKFHEGVKASGASFNVRGMAARKSSPQVIRAAKEQLIEENLRESISNNLNQNLIDKQSTFEIEEGYSGRYDSAFDTDLNLRPDDKISEVIRRVSNLYNKDLGTKFLSEGNQNKKERPEFNSDTLDQELYLLAKSSDNANEFIYNIQESKVFEVQKFNEFLEATRGKNKNGQRGDKEMFLATAFWIKKNQKDINGIYNFINKNGQLKVQDAQNNYEISQAENIMNNISDKSVERGDSYQALVESGNRIKRNDFTMADIKTIVDYFAPYGIDTTKLIERNILIVNGKVVSLSKTVENLVKSKNGMNFDPTGRYEIANYGIQNRNVKPKIINGRKVYPWKDYYRAFAQAIVNTNRKNTSKQTVKDAAGNQNPVRITQNYLTRGIERLQADAKTAYNESQFVSNHSHVNKSGTGSLSNNLLKYWYRKANDNLEIPINQNLGADNQMNGRSVNYTESTSEEERVNEVLYYFGSLNPSSGNYLMDAGRFADSSRSFILEVPFVDMNQLGKVSGKKFEFDKNPKGIVNSAYNTYKNLLKNQNLTNDDFVDQINTGIQKQIQFVNDRASFFSKVDKMKGLFTNGSLNAEGQMVVANMEINNTLNGIYFNEVFLPSYGLDIDRDKRAKQLASPYNSLGAHVQIERIPFIDPTVDMGGPKAHKITDGVAYMLSEDIERIAQLGGNMMNLGGSLKMIGTGVEYHNSAYQGKQLYDKPRMVELNDAVVAQQPQLAPLYELMKSRRQKYLDSLKAQGKEYQPNLLIGETTQVIMAVSNSSNKSQDMPSNYNSADWSLASINSEENQKVLDKWFYGKDLKGNDEFNGLMGDNYGIQTVMDKITYESVLPVQLLSSIISNADINMNQESLQQTVKAITETMHNNFADVERIFSSGSNEDVIEFMKSQFDMNAMDPKQRDLLNEGISLSVPALRTIALNTISNVVKRSSNKLVTAGAVAHSVGSLYEKPGGMRTNGSKHLQFMQQGGLDSNGNRQSSIKGEAVVPKHLSKKNGGNLRARTFLMMNPDGSQENSIGADTKGMELMTRENFVKSSESLARIRAKQYGVGYGPVYNSNNIQVGWYVEGDTILATRIPSHGVQATGVFEVVDFNASDDDSIMLPAEFIDIIDGDHDGDAIFINHKQRGQALWNQAFDDMVNHWLSPQMYRELRQKMSYSEDAQAAIKDVEKTYGAFDVDKVLKFSSEGRETSSNETRGAKGLVGVAANMNNRLNAFRAYNIGFKNSFTINDRSVNEFANETGRSIAIDSAKIMQIVLDNAKEPVAQKLGINEQTLGMAMILTNLGYNLSEVGIVLNSPVVKSYVRLKGNNNTFNSVKSSSNMEQRIKDNMKEDFKVEIPNLPSGEINISTTESVTSPENQANILKLISVLEGMNNDIININSIASGHTNLERNVFLLNEQLMKFKNVLNNEGNQQLVINDEYKTDPIIQNYIRTAEAFAKIAGRIDPTSNPFLSRIYNTIISGNVNNYSNLDKYNIQNNFESNFAAIATGMNEVSPEYMRSLITKGSPNNLFKRLNDEIKRKTILHPNSAKKSIPGRNASLLFAKGLRYSLQGNNMFISLNDSFYSKMMSDSERQALIEEFNSLDPKMVNDLKLYDLFMHGWTGSQSMFPLFSSEDKKKISQQIDFRNKNNPEMTDIQSDNLLKAIVAKNHQRIKTLYPKKEQWTSSGILNLDKSRGGIQERVLDGKPTFFKVVNPNNGKEKIIYFPGFNDDQMNEIINERNPSLRNKMRSQYIQEAISSKEKIQQGYSPNTFDPDNSNNLINIITANKGVDNSTTAPSAPTRIDVAKAIENRDNSIEGRSKKDPYLFTNKMNRETFDSAMEWNPAVTEEQRKVFYEDYLNQKDTADRIYKESVNEKTVKGMSDEELLNIYGSRKNLSDGQKGYGYRNLYAYANVNKAIQDELFNRISNEQSQVTNRKYVGKDISPIQAWLGSNNVPSNHPAVQGLVRRMEVEYKKYISERKKYMDQINDATDALYQEQFGISPNKGGLVNTLKTLWYGLFKDRKAFYEKLYGPLIVNEEFVQEDGTIVPNMRYKTETEINEGVAQGIISPAQRKFYEVTKGITDHLKQFNLDEKSGRAGYIPHTAPALLEVYSRRGMLGLFVNSKTIDERINDVIMEFKNPVTGEMETSTFKDITNVYNSLSKIEKGIRHGFDYNRLKRKAIKLAREGKNQDGSALRLSNIEIGSAIGDVFMERFSASRSRKASDFTSMDLNKAFSDYVSGTMFTNGNENFGGFKKMLPVVDGILNHLKANDNSNMYNYVNKVWKQYFLSGKKQNSNLYNSKTLESIGVTTDDTIDYLTKASLMYWLGFKGLAVGGGVYALGNVLVGKYKNVVNSGGNAWKKGEARFWNTEGGITNFGPRKANEILKRVGFMDINVYDNVNIETKNSFEKTLSNFALAPMIWSERWIQGVQFLGLLSDSEWESLKNGGTLDENRVVQLEDEVKKSQGKGYQATDQRMIQMYSWGRNMLQFSRFIPTMMYELMAPRDIDRYGKEYIGTYRMVAEGIQKVVTGSMKPAEFVKYRKGLSDTERARMDRGLMGFGLLTLLAAAGTGGNMANDLFWDSNAVFDMDKLSNKLTPPSINMVDNLIF